MGIFRYIWYQFEKIYEFGLKKFPIYYKSIDYLPVYNWFMMQNGRMEWLYKYRFFKYVPNFFYKIAQNMVYEFDKLDVTLLRKKAEITILRSKAAREKNKSYLFEANVLEKEIEKELIEIRKTSPLTLNKFLNYIEQTFNQIGSLDPFTLSTARAFSMFQEAKEKNERLSEQYQIN